MAPDGVGALLGVARGLVAAGVDDLEVIDEPVGLVEVPVTVHVVAVRLVERLQVVGDLSQRLADGQLVRHVDRQRVADQEPGVIADDAAADIAAVPGLVERHLDPLGHVAVDAVPTGRLPLVVGGHPVEVHVVVVGLVVVGLPQRRVVDAPVRLRDAVVQRAVERQSVARRRPNRRSCREMRRAACSRTPRSRRRSCRCPRG
jgi:hypothetical protein